MTDKGFLNLQVQKSWEDTPLANILVADFLVSFAIVVLVSLPAVKILMKIYIGHVAELHMTALLGQGM